MAHNPLVSCIVPVFNGALYLSEALESIFAQSYQPLEVIVVDDGSTDDTPAVIARFADRIRSARQENAGPASARNRGIELARGPLIAFLDADDLWHADKLQEQVACLAERPDADGCVTHTQNFWIDELRAEAEQHRDHRVAQPLPAYLASTLTARRSVFETIGRFDTALGFGHSTDWFLRARAHGVVIVEIPLVRYYRRLHHSNRSRRMGHQSREEFLQLVKSHLDRKRGRDT